MRSDFRERINGPLRGLYWLSKDLYENDQNLIDSQEPDAKEINEIRNHLEHKYLKLHEDDWQPNLQPSIKDSLAYSVRKSTFLAKTKRLAATARAALIYLSLAIHAEDHQRMKSRDDTRPFPITLPTL